MKKIKSIVLMTCMVAGAFLFSDKNVNAEEFKPNVIGTLTKAGDSVKVKDASKENKKYFKYVSSTDELMYLYTDAKSNDPVIEVLDKDGKLIENYDSMSQIGGEFIDYAKTGNYYNAEIFIKLKKGEEYYFSTYLFDEENLVEYNVNLIKATKKPVVDVWYGESLSNPKKLSQTDNSIAGLKYDENNYVLTMNNANIPYALGIATETDNIFSDGLVEIKVLGANTITADSESLLYSFESIVFTGNGKLTFKTKTDEFAPYTIIDMMEANTDKVCRVNGPTIESSVRTKNNVFDVNIFIMDGGKFVYSGIQKENNILRTNYLYVNGGQIDVADATCYRDLLAANYAEVNGGSIRASLKIFGMAGYDPFYKAALYGKDYVRINGGTIFIKYVEPDGDVKDEDISGYNAIESTHEINVKGGNIYIVKPERLQKPLEDKWIGLFTTGEEYNPEKAILFISDKANIQKGSTIDMSKVECSLEYTKCVYDGKEKKPAVNVDGLVEGTDYTVTYSNNINLGTAKVTVAGKGIFTGKKELSFTIEKPVVKAEAPKVGATIKNSDYIYKVTKAGSKDGKVGEVSVVGLNKKSLKKIKIAAKVTIDGVTYKVTSIGAKAFKGDKKITSVVIGKNVKKIGANAFANCKKLKKVTINSKVLKKVGKKAFYRKGGKKLTIKVPKKLKKKYKKLLKKAKTNKYVVK